MDYSLKKGWAGSEKKEETAVTNHVTLVRVWLPLSVLDKTYNNIWPWCMTCSFETLNQVFVCVCLSVKDQHKQEQTREQGYAQILERNSIFKPEASTGKVPCKQYKWAQGFSALFFSVLTWVMIWFQPFCCALSSTNCSKSLSHNTSGFCRPLLQQS